MEIWRCQEEREVGFLIRLFNIILKRERASEKWRRIALVQMFRNQGDVQSCINYKDIMLMSHDAIKLG